MIKIDNTVLRRNMERLAKRASPATLLRLVATRQLAWINQNFRDQGSERKWKPLSRRTLYTRRKGSSRILEDIGRLKKSFSMKVGTRRSIVGTVDQRAKFHDEGTGPYKIKPRSKSLLTIPDPAGNVTFKNTRNRKLDGKRGFFAKEIHHPGLPARPLLPSKHLAEHMAEKTIEAFLRAS